MTNDKDDRDATIDRLLAGAMARASEEPAGACLDADTLAAWADAALDARELAAAEAHAAGCARCQLLLATMAKTTTTMPAATATRWRMPSLGWLVPLAAAAAAIIVWILVPLRERPGNVRQVSQIAEATPPAAGAPAASEVAPPLESTAGSTMGRTREATRQKKGVEADQKVAEPAEANAAPDAPARRAEARLESAQIAAGRANAADSSPPPPPAQPSPGAAAPSAAAAPSTLAAPPAGPPPQAPAARPATVFPQATSAARAFSLVARETVVVSPNPGSRWRILPGGAVQRSADAGSTWQTQNTGVNQTLSAGASPSPSVCWLVGAGGVVLLSSDGLTWKRLAFPEAVQLVAVRATDDQAATVTTADGREFVTEDGGRTWAPAARR